jgi:hypothetical protein
MKEKKRKAGRPRLPKGQVRHVIAIRLTESEKRHYEIQAEKQAMSLSDWIREALSSHAGR